MLDTLKQIADAKGAWYAVASFAERDTALARAIVVLEQRCDRIAQAATDDLRRIDALEAGRADGEKPRWVRDYVAEAEQRAERAERDNAQLAERLTRTTETCQGQSKRAIRLDRALRIYGTHASECRFHLFFGVGVGANVGRGACTCGLQQALGGDAP
jgi:hypothetical protein